VGVILRKMISYRSVQINITIIKLIRTMDDEVIESRSDPDTTGKGLELR